MPAMHHVLRPRITTDFVVSLCLIFEVMVVTAGLEQKDQVLLNRVVSSLSVRYDVIDNLKSSLKDEQKTFVARITLTNEGQDDIAKGPWAMYLCHIRMIEAQHTKFNLTGYVIPGSNGMRVTHVNGCLFKLNPTDTFRTLKPHDSLQILFNASFWSVAKTDVMPNWYITADGLQARTITSTAGEGLSFVGEFRTANQWKRFPSDRYNPYTPQQRYEKATAEDLGKPGYIVLPTPLNVTRFNPARSAYLGTGDWIVVAPKELGKEARFLAGKLGINEVTTGASNRVFRLILLKLGPVASLAGSYHGTNQEAYDVNVDTTRMVVTIEGKTTSAVFWGVQTLMSITKEGRVPSVRIIDAPRYEYRGMHLDVARNFFSKEEVFKVIEAMCMYKLNKLHLHLTDDEGWRLEIPGIPELTKIGGRRCHDPKEETCIASQLGSGPFTGNTGSGFYTSRDYRAILQYAADRHIQVIPEFDMPGHAHSSIKAMEARQVNLTQRGHTREAGRYLLSEPRDRSKYLSAQLFKDNAINPCINSTYAFIERLVSEVKKLHDGVQPLEIFHFGGDEVPEGAWTGSPACKAVATELGLNFSSPSAVRDLKGYFVERVSRITSNYGLDLAAWEDGLLGSDEVPYDRSRVMNRRVYANTWDNVWEWGKATRPYKLANSGYKVIMTQATHLFFDHPYEPDPQERGYYWAPRFVDTRKTFGFMPDNLYANADWTKSGQPIRNVCELPLYKGKCVELRKPENIVGMSGCLWTETVRTADELHSMMHPRLLALAERAWHKAPWERVSDQPTRQKMIEEDWVQFVNTLGYKELLRLDQINVAYYIPPPGAKFVDGFLKTNSLVPGLEIQYSKNGGKTWSDVTEDLTVDTNITLVTRSADRRRTSRRITVSRPSPSSSALPTNIAIVQITIAVYLILAVVL